MTRAAGFACDLRSSLQGCARYIASNIHSSEVTLGHRLQALFGLTVLNPYSGHTERERSLELIKQIGCTLDDSSSVFMHDSKLLLLCYREILNRGVCAPSLARYAAECERLIRQVPIVPRRLAAEIHLLEDLGGDPLDRGHVIGSPEPIGDTNALLRADTSVIRTLCNRIVGESAFGLAADVYPPNVRNGLVSVLRILLLQKLREYDLMIGARLLLALKYLGASDLDEVRYAVDFLLCQQHPTGRFGYFAREVKALGVQVDLEHDLYLPVTVSVGWALAEVTSPGTVATLTTSSYDASATNQSP